MLCPCGHWEEWNDDVKKLFHNIIYTIHEKHCQVITAVTDTFEVYSVFRRQGYTS
jgi:hypothetical protein